MREAVIVSAVRTPVGKMGGGLAPLDPHELGGMVVREAVRRAGVAPESIDDVMLGNVTNKQYSNTARAIALEAGLPVEVPAITLDRQCGSALNALANAAIMIQAGVHDTVVAGGVEMDSKRPWIMARVEKAYQMPAPTFVPPIFAPASFGDVHVLQTAENLAERYSLTREECDAFALGSQQKAAKAWDEGKFDEEILPVSVKTRKGEYEVRRDETIRETSMEALAKLRCATGRPGGIVTAGNSSPNCDGASAMVVMEKEKAKEMGLESLGTFRGYAAVGVDPAYMGLGPAYAIPKLLKNAGLTMDDIDLFEINEAFATQSLACIRELKLNTDKLNVNGGAIALGHPMGATGGILTAKMVYELRRRNARYGVIAFCCGGGQGVAVLLENENR
ncbi:MAG: thiolase family protein [Lachnospiraceae bacterium]|nr:thiolase family protein [Lachnospiraceae bacterium]